MLAVILNQIRSFLSAKYRPLNLSGGELLLKIKGSQTQHKIFVASGLIVPYRKRRKGYGAEKKQTHRHVLQ